MAYRDIAKLEKFSGEEDNAYSWIADAKKVITANSWNNDRTVQTLPFFLTGTANSWYQSLAEKSTSFTEFKLTFLQYFSIKKDYYTVVQVLNQFIKRLWNSILRSVRPRHPTSLQDTITLTRDFESAEQEANHTQAVNLAINRTSDINAKITQLSEKLTQKIEGFLAGTTGTYQPPQQRKNNNNSKYPQQQNYHGPKSRKPILATQISAKHGTPIFYISESTAPICTTSPIHSTTAPELLSTTTNNTSNPSLLNFPLQPVQTNSGPSRPISRTFYFGLIEDQGFDKSTPVEGGDIEQISQPSKQTKSNIPPVTITKDITLAAIFPFDINNLNTHSLFSGTAINQDKPITALYTDARVRGIDIKLILNSGSAGSIITKQLIDQLGRQVDCAATTQIITVNENTKTPIREIDNFLFEINGIQIPTKVLVIEATQYQALIGNDWLQHAQVPAICRHFKNQCTKKPLIEFKDTSMPPTIKTYQVLWEKAELKKNPNYQRNLFYQPPRLICVNCGKKLSTMGACKWDHTLCLACGEILPDEELWNDVPGRGGTCDKASLNRLDGYLHDDHKIWRMASAKTESTTPEEIREIKDNLWMPEYTGPDYFEDDFFTDDPDTFQN
ncbi:hypothetical protein G9A89_006404 [Geosiphon pyriformis]|nr:hypothetical protein G9A89_006404 [Geosiphon pyriformis]